MERKRHHDGVGGEHIEIQPNQIPDDETVDGDLTEPGRPSFTCLVYVNDTDRADEIRLRLATIPGLEHLQRDA